MYNLIERLIIILDSKIGIKIRIGVIFPEQFWWSGYYVPQTET